MAALTCVRQKHRLLVVSVSPQARASLAAYYNLTATETHQRLVTLFRDRFGADYVCDTGVATDLALAEVRGARERARARTHPHAHPRPANRRPRSSFIA